MGGDRETPHHLARTASGFFVTELSHGPALEILTSLACPFLTNKILVRREPVPCNIYLINSYTRMLCGESRTLCLEVTMTLFPLGPVTSQWDDLSICLGDLWCICQEVIAPL